MSTKEQSIFTQVILSLRKALILCLSPCEVCEICLIMMMQFLIILLHRINTVKLSTALWRGGFLIQIRLKRCQKH